MWKSRTYRKPLIIRGARQVGKTTIVKEFAKSFDYHIFLNLEKKTDRSFFDTFEDVNDIIESLLLSKNITLDALGKTLLFIDEIQESPKAIHLLRYFYEEIPELYVIAAGSLLEFAIKRVGNFPVGRVEYLYLHPLNFAEYLEGIGHQTAIQQLHHIPVKPFAHKILLNLFNRYAIIGGMPEVLKVYLQNEHLTDLPRVYESIWGTYKDDIEKYSKNETERKVLRHIMSTAPLYLDQRIKFQNFGNSNYRSREVSKAFRHLDMANVIKIIYPTTDNKVPVKSNLRKSPRLQFLDTGIINHTLSIQAKMLSSKDLSTSFKGAIIPHLITQEIFSLNTITNHKPNFWVREKKQSSSEVDLVYVYKNKVIPIEIKSGSVGTLKSLHQFIERANHPFAIRIHAGNFNIEAVRTPAGKPFLLMNLPYYLGTKIPDYIEYFVENYI